MFGRTALGEKYASDREKQKITGEQLKLKVWQLQGGLTHAKESLNRR